MKKEAKQTFKKSKMINLNVNSLFLLLITFFQHDTTIAQTDIAFGTLSNWDTFCVSQKSSGEYEDCHGFEIEVDDILCDDILHTFGAPYNRYGNPTKTSTANGCTVTYQSGYDAGSGTWLQTTLVPPELRPGGTGKITPTNGHACYNGGPVGNYNDGGCEHYGMSLNAGKTPTATRYRWLVASETQAGTLIRSDTRVGIPAITWNVNQGAGANGGNVVQAEIEAEDLIKPCMFWGEPKWVKVFVTEIEYEMDLDGLLSDNPDVPQSQSETEIEWKVLQAPPTCDEQGNVIPPDQLAGEKELILEQEAGDGSKSILRRYEFYEYAGYIDTEWGEADPQNEPPLEEEVGNYLGAQMGALVFNPGEDPPLDISTDSLPDAIISKPYNAILEAVGGAQPYAWALDGAGDVLPEGLNLTPDGFIQGTPTEGGVRNLIVQVTDGNGDIVTQSIPLVVKYPPLLITSKKNLGVAKINGALYSKNLKANGGKPPYKWTITKGKLPSGLSLDSTSGLISGVATTKGKFRFSIQVKDSLLKKKMKSGMFIVAKL